MKKFQTIFLIYFLTLKHPLANYIAIAATSFIKKKEKDTSKSQ